MWHSGGGKACGTRVGGRHVALGWGEGMWHSGGEKACGTRVGGKHVALGWGEGMWHSGGGKACGTEVGGRHVELEGMWHSGGEEACGTRVKACGTRVGGRHVRTRCMHTANHHVVHKGDQARPGILVLGWVGVHNVWLLCRQGFVRTSRTKFECPF